MSETNQYKCPDCDAVFTTASALGPHRRLAHGYRKSDGKSNPKRATKAQRKITRGRVYGLKLKCPDCDFVAQWKGGLTRHIRAAHQPKEAQPERSTAIVKSTAVSEVQPTAIVSRNGHHRAQAEARRSLIPEATLAFTAGRVEELLSHTAAEFDVPARTFTAGVLELIYAKTLRK